MIHTWLAHLPLFAQQAGDAAPPSGQGSPFASMLPMIAMFAVLAYFMLFRPERQKQQTHKKMLERLKKSDRVVTFSGIKGIVYSIHRDADEIALTVDESTGTKIRVTLDSISRVEGEPSAEEKK